MYNLLCVLLKINRQSITCPLVEVFTTFHWRRGRTLAPGQSGGYRLRVNRWKDAASQTLQKSMTTVTPGGHVGGLNPESAQRTCTVKNPCSALRWWFFLQITVLCFIWPALRSWLCGLQWLFARLKSWHKTIRVKKIRDRRKRNTKKKKKNHNLNIIDALKKSVRPKQTIFNRKKNQVLHIRTMCPAHAFCWPPFKTDKRQMSQSITCRFLLDRRLYSVQSGSPLPVSFSSSPVSPPRHSQLIWWQIFCMITHHPVIHLHKVRVLSD